MLSAAERFDCTVEPSRSTEPSIEMYKFGFSINFSNHFDIVAYSLLPWLRMSLSPKVSTM
jgi:hypothetical protein